MARAARSWPWATTKPLAPEKLRIAAEGIPNLEAPATGPRLAREVSTVFGMDRAS